MNLLHYVATFSPGDRTIAVVRHSERASFHNIPIDEWESIGITENGYLVAKNLGKSLAKVGGFSRANIYSWGALRCVETAVAVAQGLVEEGVSARSPGNLTLRGPVSDYAAFKEFLTSGRWTEMLESWQSGRDVKGSLMPVAEYAPMIFKEILHPRTSPREELSLIATHDINVLPLVRHAIKANVDPPDYLDGLVIGEHGNEIEVGYGDLLGSTELGSLTR